MSWGHCSSQRTVCLQCVSAGLSPGAENHLINYGVRPGTVCRKATLNPKP